MNYPFVSWLQEHVHPTPDRCGRNAYRCAATLKDGTHLPCVLVRGATAEVELAIRRFDETRDNGVSDPRRITAHYPSIVASFVGGRSRVGAHAIATVERSPFAIPAERMLEVKGETRMSWTAFAAVMDDGREASFGTTWHRDFFAMPDGYDGSRVARIIPHKHEVQPVYRERQHFECLIPGADFGEWKRPPGSVLEAVRNT